MDTNSAFFAKYCFSLGINLKRIEVIADDEVEIGEAAKRMSENYDFVVTRYVVPLLQGSWSANPYCYSGGIGPTSVRHILSHTDLAPESYQFAGTMI